MGVRENHLQVDAIIVGGGLAGIHLALAMNRQGLKPLVVDKPDLHSSSRIAAGIINPITGRRFALTWLYNELEPAFIEVYRYWEDQWNSRFFRNVNILRSIPGNKLVNDLDAKLLDDDYKIYCRKMEKNDIGIISPYIRFQEPGYSMYGYQVDTELFLDQAIEYLKSKKQYLEGTFAIEAGFIQTNLFRFQNYQSEKLIDATGASVVFNKLFQWVRMNPNKGEILIFQADSWLGNDIVKQNSFFVPMGYNRIWSGSFNTWTSDNRQPTTHGYEYLTKIIDRIIKVPFHIDGHLAAIRPAVEDRRPVIGSHPENPNIYIFNGFGSKGCSLIPFFAKQMIGFMDEMKTIHPEADVKRYWA